MSDEIQELMKEAKHEFAEYERLSDPVKRIKCFRNAVDILNEIIPKITDENQKYIINKMKLSRARLLFQSLENIDFSIYKDANGFAIWLQYMFVLLEIDDQKEIILAENPKLIQVYENFRQIYREEIELLEKYGAKIFKS